MTKTFGDYNLSINLRNGVGLDLEFTESRAIWVILDSSEKYEAAQFEGIVICLPFCVITCGQVYLPED
jgi:hypothetical protein|tara:strand:- start:891 stop:1094 length:204 start_codon:yes stop_codon:yes gene_type:complete